MNQRMKYVWMFEAFILSSFIFSWFLIVYILFPFEGQLFVGIPNNLFIIGAAATFSAMLFFAVAVGAELFYRNFEYIFSDEEFIVRKGMLKRTEHIIPYKQITSAKVLRTGIHALDQIFGLTCIKILWSNGFVIIPGISEPELFLRRLMANVEGNEYIKNSTVYMSEREILLKLSSSLRNVQAKLDELASERKKPTSSKWSKHEYPAEFLRSAKKESQPTPIINIKTFSDLKKKGKRKKKDDKHE